jgi:hypothetical protein
MLRLTPNRPEVLDEVFDGEAVLVHLGTGRYYAFSPAATQVWAALGSGADWTELAAGVGVAEPELVDFVHQLVEDQLVTVAGELPARPDVVAAHGPTFEVFTDMQDLLLLDPIHDINLDGSGWPESA